MSLILKSNSVFLGTPLLNDMNTYTQRVLADGGVIANAGKLTEMFIFMLNNGIKPVNIFSATSASWGVKKVGGEVVKLYSLASADGDLIVTGTGVTAVDGYLQVGYVANTKIKTAGTFLHDDSVSMFVGYDVTSSTATKASTVAELTQPVTDTRLAQAIFNNVTKTYTAVFNNGINIIADTPASNNIGVSVDAGVASCIVSGVDVSGKISSSSSLLGRSFGFYLASTQAGSSLSHAGKYRVAIVTKGLSEQQRLSVSTLVASY